MNRVVQTLGITVPEFVAGLALVVFALAVMLVALRASRAYADTPRGEFPRIGKHPLRRAGTDEAPLRSAPPEMSPGVGGFLYRGSAGDESTTATLFELARRGYIGFVFMTDHTTAGQRVYIVRLDRESEGDDLPEDARSLLAVLESGRAESAAYAAANPVDSVSYRSALESAGLPVEGKPLARVQGYSLRASLAQAEAEKREVLTRGWYSRRREALGTIGAVLAGVGALGALGALIWLIATGLGGFWFGVSAAVALMGLVAVLRYSSLTPDGIVACDQVAGFRRFLIEAPRSEGATLAGFAGYSSWASALDCMKEWENSLERLAVVENMTVADAVPWMVSTSNEWTTWAGLTEALMGIERRLHSHPLADDLDASPRKKRPAGEGKKRG